MPAKKPALAFIFITLVLDILGIGLIIPILPKLIENFMGGSVPEASRVFGWLAALYSLMQFLFAPLLGSLSDRFGRRPVILGSLLGSGLDYFLLAFAPTLQWFFAGRIIAGITGANFSAANAYIADITPPEKRAANFGLVGAAFGLGFIIGPALGGWLGEHFGLRAPFIVAGCLTLTNWLYGCFVLPESLAAENRRNFSWARSNPVGSLLALRRYPTVLALVAIYFLFYLAHASLPATWVLYTGHRYGWNLKEVGYSLAIVGLMSAIVQAGLTRVIVAKFGERRTILFGLTMATLAYAGYGAAPAGWMIYVILVFGSLGGVSGPTLQGYVSRSVGADEQGGLQGAISSLASVAGIIGPPVVSHLFSAFIAPEVPVKIPGIAFFFSAALMVVALTLAVRALPRRTP